MTQEKRNIVFSGTSKRNLIQVLEQDKGRYKGHRVLFLNDEKYVYSVVPDKGLPKEIILNTCCMAPLLENIESVLILGTGPGAMLSVLRTHYPDLHFDAVEIDPQIIEVGYKYFNLERDPKINIIISDAREFVEETKKKYDLIIVDVFEDAKTPKNCVP